MRVILLVITSSDTHIHYADFYTTQRSFFFFFLRVPLCLDLIIFEGQNLTIPPHILLE